MFLTQRDLIKVTKKPSKIQRNEEVFQYVLKSVFRDLDITSFFETPGRSNALSAIIKCCQKGFTVFLTSQIDWEKNTILQRCCLL